MILAATSGTIGIFLMGPYWLDASKNLGSGKLPSAPTLHPEACTCMFSTPDIYKFCQNKHVQHHVTLAGSAGAQALPPAIESATRVLAKHMLSYCIVYNVLIYMSPAIT